MPEWAELWRKTGQRGLLIASYKRLKKDSDRALITAVEAVHVPIHLAPPGSLQAKQPCHLHAQLLLEQSCTGKKKSCIYVCRVASVVSNSLWPCRLWPARLPWQEGDFSKQEYWSLLANTGCHTLLEHYISCCPSCQFPWVPSAARTTATQAAASLHTWPSQGRTQVLQDNLRSKPQWTTHMQRWK